MASQNQEKVGWFKGLIQKIVNFVNNVARDVKKLGSEDPRRVVHSLKVGLSITLVSLFYYFDVLFQGFGIAAMWAVMTVVVVFEFSVGATLGKGVNRGIATLVGGGLGVGAHQLASLAGDKAEYCVVLGSLVFLIAAMTTFVRFYPKLKARYDYGLLIFILTFCLISVSGYRNDEVLEMAHKRLSAVLVGGAAAVFIGVFIWPVWAGKDLHDLTASNIEILSIFLEGFGHEYFETADDKGQETRASMDGYKTVLNSKGTEEALVNFAKWEPRHGKFRYRHPWDQYLKILGLTRECTYKIDALNGYLKSEMQTPLEIRAKIQEPCMKMSLECSYALKELALGINTMTNTLPANAYIMNARDAAKKLKATLKTGLWPDTDLLDIIPAATVASLLTEIVSCSENIAIAVHELASLSKYKHRDGVSPQTPKGKVTRTPSIQSHSLSIAIHE